MIKDKDNANHNENNAESSLDEQMYFGINNNEEEKHIEGQSTTAFPDLGKKSEFDNILDEQNPKSDIDIIVDNNKQQELSKKQLKAQKKQEKKSKKKQEFVDKKIEELSNNDDSNEVGISKQQEVKIEKENKKIDENSKKYQYHSESSRMGLHYVDAYDIDIDAIKPFDLRKKKYHKNTELYINTKIYNRFIDYSPSDFSPTQIRDLFIDFSLVHLPNNSGFKLKIFPNDSEGIIRVEVYLNRFYKYGEVIEKRRAFAPFWISGFGESILYASTMRPIEKKYRVNQINTFAYRETTKILNKKISAKYITLSKDKYATEQDFKQAQALKNAYIKHHIERLNMINTIEWECVPDLYVNWSNRSVSIKLYLKVISTIDYARLPYLFYVDAFNVNLNELLDLKKQQSISFDDNPRHKKTSKTLIDINTIMYLIALNAMYKNILVFSYNTLYECYKSIAYQTLAKGYDLKQITPSNLSSLKIVDLSKHFVCQKRMFDDRLLHLMNLKSANEEYYRMKYMYTVQKQPNLLYSDFIVREFEHVGVNDLALLLRNEEERAWRKRIDDLQRINTSSNAWDKDFYINNYNIFDYTKHEFSDVESYLMDIIKDDKDEISRISALGKEILMVDQKQFFTKKELRELQRTSRKLNRIEVK